MAENLKIIKVVIEYADDKSVIDEWEDYEQIAQCCNLIENADPCTDEGKVEPWAGFSKDEVDIDFEAIFKQEQSRYPTGYLKGYKVEMVGGDGPLCGEKHTTFVGQLGCCEIQYPMYWADDETITSVSRGEQYTFTVNGGTAFAFPSNMYSWNVIGKGVKILGNPAYGSIRVEIDDCFCEPALLVVSDSCGEQIIKLLHVSSWNSIATVARDSNYGWFQSGQTTQMGQAGGSGIYVFGFNGDRTEYSMQGYGIGLSDTPPCLIDTGTLADYSATALVIPVGYDGWTNCEGTTVFWKDISNDPNYEYDFMYVWATTTTGNQVTKEWVDPGYCEDDLLYDDTNSVSILADDSSGTIFWQGGTSPYTISVSGVEIFTDFDRTLTQKIVSGTNTELFTGNACGPLIVTITDNCGESVQGIIFSTEGTQVRVGYWYPQIYLDDHCENPFGSGNYICPWITNPIGDGWSTPSEVPEYFAVIGEYTLTYDYDYHATPGDLSLWVAGLGATGAVDAFWYPDPYLGIFSVPGHPAFSGSGHFSHWRFSNINLPFSIWRFEC